MPWWREQSPSWKRRGNRLTAPTVGFPDRASRLWRLPLCCGTAGQADSPSVAKSLQYLAQFVHPDGGIYQEGTLYQNYETCLAILCFERGESRRPLRCHLEGRGWFRP